MSKNKQNTEIATEQGGQVHDIVRHKLFTFENLKHIDRDRPPQTTTDFDYFINQLIDSGQISLSEGVKLYYHA